MLTKMLAPKYTITQEILNNLTEIERLYGRLQGLQIPKHLLLNLERDNLVQSSYSSNKIEGNPLSHLDVSNLLLDERVPVNRDEKEVTNYFEILKSLQDKTREKLNVQLVLDLHENLLNGVEDQIKGKFRDIAVVVGKMSSTGEIIVKHNPPAHKSEEIEKLVQDLLEWVETSNNLAVLKAGIFHHQYVYFHPHIDGNGRICRLLTALIFLKNNYLINKYFVLDEYYDIDRDLYSDKLHSADAGDKTEWLEYFTEGVKHSLMSALMKIENGLNKLSFDIRPSKKEKEALNFLQVHKEISTAELAIEMNISRQRAFGILKSLVEKGFVEQKNAGKASYYVLK